VVHSVYSLLARGVAGAGPLSDRVVTDSAVAHLGHRRTRGFEPYQRALFAPRATSPWTEGHLKSAPRSGVLTAR